jgi:hypothetical protein
MTSGDYEYILPSARTAIAVGGDPRSYWEAINSAQKEEQVTTMKEDTDVLVENNTCELVDCPKNVTVIDNRLVLRTKLNASRSTGRERTCAKSRHKLR